MTHPQHTSPSPVGQPSVSALAQSPADRVRSLLHSADRPLIIGILNVTPQKSAADAFADPHRILGGFLRRSASPVSREFGNRRSHSPWSSSVTMRA
jgi:hypothetical protein